MLRPHFLISLLFNFIVRVLRALLIGRVCGNYTEHFCSITSTRTPAQSAPAPAPAIHLQFGSYFLSHKSDAHLRDFFFGPLDFSGGARILDQSEEPPEQQSLR